MSVGKTSIFGQNYRQRFWLEIDSMTLIIDKNYIYNDKQATKAATKSLRMQFEIYSNGESGADFLAEDDPPSKQKVSCDN